MGQDYFEPLIDANEHSFAKTMRLEQEGYDLMSAAFEVYNTAGRGFTEEIYQETLEMELTLRGIPFLAQPGIELRYKEMLLKHRFRPDLLVHDEIIVELKAVTALAPEHEAQLLNYLKASAKPVGYLLNFGSTPKLEWRRFVL